MSWCTRPACAACIGATLMLVAGCASSPVSTVGALEGSAQTTKHMHNPTDYKLSDHDRTLDCKVIRGRMKVAIFQLQSQRKIPTSTSLSRSMQTTAAGLFGGTTYGTNPTANAARETARLRAYNGLLKERNCETYDLRKELALQTPS